MAFAYKQAITIDSTKCGSADTTDFSFLFSGTYAQLATVANGGYVQNASGYDIGFYSDSALTTKLDWERELYVDTTGQVIYWVRIPTLTFASNTVIYLAYGDAAVTTDQSNADGAWEANFVGVYHFGTASLVLTDSSGATADLTNAGGCTSQASGQISRGVNINASYLTQAGFNYTSGAFTFSAWVKPNSFTVSPVLLYKGQYQTNGYYFQFNSDGTAFLSTNQAAANQTTSATAFSTGAWQHLVISRNGTAVKIYRNGVDVTTSPGTHTNPTSSSDAFELGTYNTSAGLEFDGAVDELQVASTNRSASWALASYNNQSSPSTFYRLQALAGVTGTATASITEADVVAGGKTIVITLISDTWIA